MLKNKSIVFLLFLFLLFPAIALADGIVPCGNSGQGACTLCHLIIGIYNLIAWGKNILVTAAIVAIFISGIMYILAAGGAMMETAKKFLTSSIIGFTIVLGAWLMVSTVMWMLSAKTDLGINKPQSNWYGVNSIKFDCDATSSSGSGGSGSGNSTPANFTCTNCCGAGNAGSCYQASIVDECPSGYSSSLIGSVQGDNCASGSWCCMKSTITCTNCCGSGSSGMCVAGSITDSCPTGYQSTLIGSFSGPNCPSSSWCCTPKQ
jgi:hypothetical protein